MSSSLNKVEVLSSQQVCVIMKCCVFFLIVWPFHCFDWENGGVPDY